MAIIECPYCKELVSSNAIACPHCGKALKAIDGTLDLSNMRQCKECGVMLPFGTLTCPECGWSETKNNALRRCAECGAALPSEAVSCKECGAPAALAEAPVSNEKLSFIKKCNIYGLLSMLVPIALLFCDIFSLEFNKSLVYRFGLRNLTDLLDYLENKTVSDIASFLRLDKPLKSLKIYITIAVVVLFIIGIGAVVDFIKGWVRLGSGRLNSGAFSTGLYFSVWMLLFILVANIHISKKLASITVGLGIYGIILLVWGIVNFVLFLVLKRTASER